jgi:hypothetical protein
MAVAGIDMGVAVDQGGDPGRRPDPGGGDLEDTVETAEPEARQAMERALRQAKLKPEDLKKGRV